MELADLRAEIDRIDAELSRLFCERMEVSRQVGEYKRENSLPVYDAAREEQKLADIMEGVPEYYREAVRKLYERIFALSRGAQKKCGLLGLKLGHSYSPLIHSRLADYEYLKYEKSPEELEDFIINGDWDGLNVTIPYKKAVMPYCTVLSERAEKIGSVNTLVRKADGSIFGDNTDAYGFELLIKKLDTEPRGKKAVILGSGGACAAVKQVLKEMGVRELRVISRRGEDNYDNLSLNYDAEIIVNTTPLGMYPHNGRQAVDLRNFPSCEAVLDLVYNPARTALIMQAESLGIPCAGGIHMLVCQAWRSSSRFSGVELPLSLIDEVTAELRELMENIVLIGMPGCGKSVVSQSLSRLCGRAVYDSDTFAEEKAGMSIPEIFEKYGEDKFRELETEAIAELSKMSGCIIATGGGAVKRKENYPLLHQNSRIVWLKRDLELLPSEGRPVSQKNDLKKLFEKRKELYASFADYSVDNNGSPEAAARMILEAVK